MVGRYCLLLQYGRENGIFSISLICTSYSCGVGLCILIVDTIASLSASVCTRCLVFIIVCYTYVNILKHFLCFIIWTFFKMFISMYWGHVLGACTDPMYCGDHHVLGVCTDPMYWLWHIQKYILNSLNRYYITLFRSCKSPRAVCWEWFSATHFQNFSTVILTVIT